LTSAAEWRYDFPAFAVFEEAAATGFWKEKSHG
jgi:hypothetical protein